MDPVAREPEPADAAYELVADWPELPADMTLGEAAGVAVDAQGRVYVFHRAGRGFDNEEPIGEPTVLVLDGDQGTVLARWGAGVFLVPHGIAVDPEGDVWLTDVGRNRVHRFRADGQPVLEIGVE